MRRLGARLVLSAGGSVFALRVHGKAGASARREALRAGDRVDGKARVRRGGLEAGANTLIKVGHDGQLVLEGIYLATAEDGTIELAVVHRGPVFVKVPEGMEVPAFEPGDEIALLVTVEADGSFTLVKGENEDDGDEELSVAGILASVSAEEVAVKVEGHPEPLRCDVPEDFDLTGFEAGQRVYMTCELSEGSLVLVELKHKDTPPPPGALTAEGTISELDASHIGVEVDEHGGARHVRGADRDEPARVRRRRRGAHYLRQERPRRLRGQDARLRPCVDLARGLVVRPRGADRGAELDGDQPRRRRPPEPRDLCGRMPISAPSRSATRSG